MSYVSKTLTLLSGYWKEWTILLFWSILLYVLFFPNFDFTYSIGIDPPLKWVFNYLIKNQDVVKNHIIFPHGPLAFLIYPLAENFFTASLLRFELLCLVVFNLYYLAKAGKGNAWVWTLPGSVIIVAVSGLNLLILLNILISYLLCFVYNKYYKYLGFILAALAFYINAYSAIIAGMLSLSFLVIQLLRNKKPLVFIMDGVTILGFVFIGWLLLYKSAGQFINYFIGIINLASDNSSAVSYYPDNNWWLLGVFIVLTMSVLFINRSKKGILFMGLAILSLFAAWKHGMAREDIYHVRGFFFLAVSFFTLHVVFVDKKRVVNIILLSVALFAFFGNIKNTENYQPVKIPFSGTKNFVSLVKNYDSIVLKSGKTTLQNIQSNSLPEGIQKRLKESTADVYPWDYSIIPANELTWQPRPVLHSYASYTPWLDNRNATHFNGENAPEFIIWDLEKITTDINGGTFGSIDKRYLLNNEPATIFSIIKQYDRYFKNKQFLVLKKRIKPLLLSEFYLGQTVAGWNEWIKVPNDTKGILRAKVSVKNNLWGTMKSFLYKDEETFVYYKTISGEVYPYKIVPKNAKNGLWINPLILDPAQDRVAGPVGEIYFVSSNTAMMHNEIEVEWFSYEDKNESGKNPALFLFVNGPEKRDSNPHIIKKIVSVESMVDAGAYSESFSFVLDTLKFRKCIIETDSWVYGKDIADVKYVISIENSNGAVVYNAKEVSHQVVDRKSWNLVKNRQEYLINSNRGTLLKIYFWNTGNSQLLLKDFRLKIINQSTPAEMYLIAN